MSRPSIPKNKRLSTVVGVRLTVAEGKMLKRIVRETSQSRSVILREAFLRVHRPSRIVG